MLSPQKYGTSTFFPVPNFRTFRQPFLRTPVTRPQMGSSEVKRLDEKKYSLVGNLGPARVQ
jgi:hypothetical protein